MSDQAQQTNTPVNVPVYQEPQAPVMSTTDWFFTQLILSIPLVNIIVLIMWAAGSSGNVNRRNFCRATLLWAVIAFLISAAIFAFALSSGGTSSVL